MLVITVICNIKQIHLLIKIKQNHNNSRILLRALELDTYRIPNPMENELDSLKQRYFSFSFYIDTR